MKDHHLQKASLAGSLITALMASICCIGPVVFALLGVSGAGFLLKFEKFRPHFIVIAVILLGAGFFLTYRQKSAAHCEPNTLCANPKSRTINKIVLWISTILIAGFIFFPMIISRFV